MRLRGTLIAALGVALAVPAAGVGLGPLSREGVTDGPAKGFYLTVSNPYAEPRNFRAYPMAEDDAAEATATLPVDIRPARFRLAAGGQRRILVIAQGLVPGETRRFRVCAELAQQEGMIHARVCSKLAARRLAR
jgi:P pilus assembly chaperone PapD